MDRTIYVYFMDAYNDSGRDGYVVSEGIKLSAFMEMLMNVEGIVPSPFQQVLAFRPVAVDAPLEQGDFVVFIDQDQLSGYWRVGNQPDDVDPHKDNYRGRSTT